MKHVGCTTFFSPPIISLISSISWRLFYVSCVDFSADFFSCIFFILFRDICMFWSRIQCDISRSSVCFIFGVARVPKFAKLIEKWVHTGKTTGWWTGTRHNLIHKKSIAPFDTRKRYTKINKRRRARSATNDSMILCKFTLRTLTKWSFNEFHADSHIVVFVRG